MGARALSTAPCDEPRSGTSSSIGRPETCPAPWGPPPRVGAPTVPSAPSAASRLATAAPIPLPPPVTSAFLPSSLMPVGSLIGVTCSLLAGGRANPDPRWHRRTRLWTRREARARGSVDRDRLTEARARGGGCREAARGRAGGRDR